MNDLQVAQVARSLATPASIPAPTPAPRAGPSVLAQLLRSTKAPKFAGSRDEDIRSWLYMIEKAFLITPDAVDNDKIAFAVQMLEKHAADWWRYLDISAGLDGTSLPSTWSSFSDVATAKFEPVNAVEQVRDKLAAMRQTGSVSAYAVAMCNLFQRLPTLHPLDRLDRFCRTLKPDVQRELRLRRPETLEDAIRMAESFDTLTYRHDTRAFAPVSRNNGPQPMELGALYTDENEDEDGRGNEEEDDEYEDLRLRMNAMESRFERRLPTTAPPPPKTIGAPLTAEQKTWARAKGLCWNCYKTGHGSSTCPLSKHPKDVAPRS